MVVLTHPHMNLRKHTSKLLYLGFPIAAFSISLPVTYNLMEKMDQSTLRIGEAIKDFDGKPELTGADWEILYSRLGGKYSSEIRRPALCLSTLCEIEERLPLIR